MVEVRSVDIGKSVTWFDLIRAYIPKGKHKIHDRTAHNLYDDGSSLRTTRPTLGFLRIDFYDKKEMVTFYFRSRVHSNSNTAAAISNKAWPLREV